MLDWEGLHYLAALAKTGTLSAAARQLRVEHATVSRRIASLEETLGLRLLDRRGRKVLLTADGERVAAMALRMEENVLAAERLALSARTGLGGTVTLSVPPALAAAKLVVSLVALQRSHPGLMLQVLGEHREAALHRREADIAVRLSRPVDGELTAMKLGEIAFHFYASRDYLNSTLPEQWSFVGYDDSMADSPQMKRLRAYACDREIRFVANSSDLQLAAVRAGAGVGILPDFMAGNDPALSRLDETGEPMRREVWLVVHTDLRRSAAVRAVMEALVEGLKAEGA